jgi:outer membrane protein OmpA-like peptidoglycan-associated protein
VKSTIYFSVTLACVLAGCATTPPQPDEALTRARVAVQALEANPMASQSAGKPLQDARDALAQAERARNDHQPPDIIDHYAFLAERYAETGEADIGETSARDQLAKAQSERDHVLLEARERDADAAKQQADTAKQQAREAEASALAAASLAQQRNADANSAEQQLAAMQQQYAELQAKQTERGMVLTLGNVLFDTAKDTLKPGADLTIQRLNKFLADYPNIRIRVEGHTDSRGGDEYNMDLSKRRAQSVADALTAQGTSADRIEVVPRGKGFPVASNDTPEGRQQNRRVEVVFSDQQGHFAG